MTRHALRVIASRDRNHTALLFFLTEEGQLVGGAAFLERSDRLKVLQLQPDICARHFRKRGASNAWRTNNMRSDPLMSGKNIGEGERMNFGHVLLFVLADRIGPPCFRTRLTCR